MPAINDLINRVVPNASPRDEPALTLGLPLETDEKTIYPVFQELRTEPADDQKLRQIGYLEIGPDRSDFVSLEPDRRAPLAILSLIALVVVIGLLARRIRG